MTVEIIQGDCLEVLRGLPAESVNCCVTSPPYWGLRDYGCDGQLGLEKTPDEFVAKMVEVFAEVRRVLRGDGIAWLNLGDSYARMQEGNVPQTKHKPCIPPVMTGRVKNAGLKPKDLVGIPWRVAFALQSPRYSGRIKDERDRIWLAAMLDAEGCMFIHKRKTGQNNGQGYERKNDSYASGLEISNTHEAIVNRCMAIAGVGSICTQDGGRRQRLYRWNVRTTECRELMRELYPYLVAKQHQARLAYGCPSSGEQAAAAHAALIELHNGISTKVDFPEPASCFSPGWYLRQDIIWKKPNPMPESVTDRCTKSHEYIFLLAKSERYYFNQDAISEPLKLSSISRLCQDVESQEGSTRVPGKTNGNMKAVARNPSKAANIGERLDGGAAKTGNPQTSAGLHRNGGNAQRLDATTRNKRSVWTVTTKPYKGAHFATFPPDLIKPCILAGCPEGGTVLDPFFGSGTTGQVAEECGCNCIGIELNPEYVKLAKRRNQQRSLLT